jgi:Flp pilus assembly protein TadG
MTAAFARDTHGASAVEFALVAPLLFLIIVGILDLGRAVNAYVTVSNAAQEGTHYAALHPTANPTAIASAVRQRVAPLAPSAVNVSTSYYDQASATFVAWPASPTPNANPTHTDVRVSVTYSWAAVTFIGSFFPGGSGATFSVSSTVDMVR